MPLFGQPVSLVAPLPSLGVIDAGLTIPRRSFDRWTMGAKPPTTTLVSVAGSALVVNPVPGNGGKVATFPLTGTCRLRIDNEEMLVSAGLGGTSWTVTRATNGTTGVAHTAGANVLGSGITHVALCGDSTMQGTVGANDEFAQRLSRMLGRTMGGANGLVGRGFRGLWLSDNNVAGGAGNSIAEWSALGTWSLVTPGSADDQAPWGWGLTASGSANVLIWTRPANIQVAAIEVQLVPSVNLNQPSYSTDGGTTWINIPFSSPLHELQSFIVPITNPTDFRIRAANAAGTAQSVVINGIIVWSTAPNFGTTQGVMVHNLGMDGNTLANFVHANASGDSLAFFDGHQGSVYPDLVVVGPFTNDVISWNPATYIANLTTLVNRVSPYADVLVVGYAEQNSRSTTDQASLRAACKTVAATLNVGELDVYDAFAAEGLVGYAAVNAAGLMFDGLHCNQAGNNAIAARLMRALGLTTL